MLIMAFSLSVPRKQLNQLMHLGLEKILQNITV